MTWSPCTVVHGVGCVAVAMSMRGLPPTPIALPGEAALRAVFAPSDGEALYFVAKGDGSHAFSASLEEHEENVRRYQLIRRADYRSSPSISDDQ